MSPDRFGVMYSRITFICWANIYSDGYEMSLQLHLISITKGLNTQVLISATRGQN